MSKEILILGRADDGRDGFDSADKFRSIIQNQALDGVFAAAYEDLIFEMASDAVQITDGHNNRELESYDIVYFTGWFKHYSDHVYALAHYLSEKGVTFHNKEAINNRSRGKINQYVLLAQNGLPFPDSYYANHTRILEKARSGGFEFPLIIKAPLASKGQDNFLIDSMDMLERRLHENPGTDFIVQKFIPNKGDLRVLVFGDTVPFAIGRKAQAGSHLNNTSMGGSAEKIPTNDLPEQVVADSIKACQLFDREFAGVDIVIDETGQHYFMEVTNLPQIATGAFVDDKVTALIERLRS